MSDAQDELLQQYLDAAQITNTIRLIRFFLVSILIEGVQNSVSVNLTRF
jgi:hypothetical protein